MIIVRKTEREMMMFISSNFVDRGEYVFYNYRFEEKFVARFKRGGKASKAAFIKFLKANFTPDEYFARREINGETPLGILKAKGYVSPMMKKMMKRENRG
jgi:hypothetical protein|tara:strand:+ start:550 stop:849 length:300 start_codon:yes stop_codon:yes gene_type:complete